MEKIYTHIVMASYYSEWGQEEEDIYIIYIYLLHTINIHAVKLPAQLINIFILLTIMERIGIEIICEWWDTETIF